MNSNTYYFLAVAVMAVVTALIRFLPFILFKRKTPKIIEYLGSVLPFAIMGMLVVYCLKGTTFLSGNHGIPEAVACTVTVILHKLKHNTLLSIAGGTAIYMITLNIL